jgi:hypothetical protein
MSENRPHRSQLEFQKFLETPIETLLNRVDRIDAETAILDLFRDVATTPRLSKLPHRKQSQFV